MTAPASDSTPVGKGTVCPSCNRFVGAYDRCPYCGTGIRKRIPLKSIRIAALLVALAGMLCLHIMAMYRDLPTKSIGEITPAMNFGYISVKGQVTQPLRFYRDGDTINGIGFAIEDDSGQMRVRAYRTVADALHRNGLVLRRGDTVKVSGTLRIVEGDNISMLLQVPSHLELLQSSDAVSVSLDELSTVEDGQNVQLSANISRIVAPSSERTPYRISLKDDTGSSSLVIWPNQFDEITGRDQLMEGTLVKVRASKSSYRNTPQLQIESSQDLVILAAASDDAAKDTLAADDQKTVALGSLSSADKDSVVTVQATVKQFNTPTEGSRTPYVITLTDGSLELPLVFWADTYSKLKDPDKIIPGTVLSARVRVSEYRGKPQLVLASPEGLKVVKASETAAVKPAVPKKKEVETVKPTDATSVSAQTEHQEMSLDEALAQPAGSRVKITGVVERVIPAAAGSSAPTRIILKSGSGPVTVVCWEDAWSRIPEKSRPVPGATIQVSATVAVYRDAKQLRLLHSSNYALLDAAAAPKNASGTMALKDVGTAELGTKVTVEGTVESVRYPQTASSPYIISITDGDTSIPVVIWKDTWELLPEYNRPKKGATLIVSGKVSEYKDTRQIQVDSKGTVERVK